MKALERTKFAAEFELESLQLYYAIIMGFVFSHLAIIIKCKSIKLVGALIYLLIALIYLLIALIYLLIVCQN